MNKHPKYPFGYLLSRYKKTIEDKIPKEFTVFEDDIVLAYDKSQSFIFEKQNKCFVGILGSIYHIKNYISNKDIIKILLEKLLLSEEEFFKFLKNTLGRFLIIYKKEESIYVLSENIRLNLLTGKVSRFYPGLMSYDDKQLSVDEVSNLIINASKILLNDLIKKNKKLSLSLTGGIDSRITLALVKIALGNDLSNIQFWIYKNTETPNYKLQDGFDGDVVITKILAKKLKLNHTLFNRNEFLNKNLKEFIANSLTYYDALLISGIHNNVKSDIELRSNNYEIGRAYYHSYYFVKRTYRDKKIAKENKLAHIYLAPILNFKEDNLFYTPERIKKVENIFFSFFKETEFFNATKYIDELDLFYWEHRMGSWLPHVYLQSDILFDTLNLVNSWAILEALLNLPLEDRINAKVYKKILNKGGNY